MVPPHASHNPQVLIEEGAMSSIEIRSAIRCLNHVLATHVARYTRVQLNPMLTIPVLALGISQG